MSSELRAGSRFGQYVLGRRLGGGGFGDVWLAHTPASEPVALKVLNGQHASPEAARLRAEIELLAAAASAKSRHIVRVLGGGSEPAPHVVMEYIEGTDLAAVISHRGALPVSEVLRIADGVADALAALQQAGIIHRDIKPANVMIDAHGLVKLTDFGIAKIVGIDTVTATNQLPMSMAYAAPEVWEGKTSHLSDHYAFGALLYHCLAGRPPFSGNYAEIYRHHLATAPDLDALASDTPAALRRLIGDCLNKDPAERPADAFALKSAIAAAEQELLRDDATIIVPRVVEPKTLGPWIIENRDAEGDWSFVCRHENTGEKALVELHFADDLEYGMALRRAVAVNPELVPLGAERLLATSRLVLRPGEAWKGALAGDFQFWVAREMPEDCPPATTVSAETAAKAASALQTLIQIAASDGVSINLKPDRLSMREDGSVRLVRPGLPPFADTDPETDAQAFLQSLRLKDDSITQFLDPALEHESPAGFVGREDDDGQPGLSSSRGQDSGQAAAISGANAPGNSANSLLTSSPAAAPQPEGNSTAKHPYLSYLGPGPSIAGVLALVALLVIAVAVISTGPGSIEHAATASVQPASFYIERGDKYYASDLFDLALLDYNRAIVLEPENAGAYNGLGKVYHAQKDEEAALAAHTKAIELDPNKAPFYAHRGNAYRNLKQSVLALADYNKATELDSAYEVPYNGRGNLLYDAGRYSEAVAEYGKAIELVPAKATFYNNRGWAYKNLGKSELALPDFSKAIELDAKQTNAYIGRANVNYDARRYDLAVGDYTKAIELEPSSFVYRNRGSAYKNLGKTELARADFEVAKSLAKTPDDVQRSQALLDSLK